MGGYAYTLERTAYGQNGLSARLHAYRERWIRRALDRDARMVDMQIMITFRATRRSLPPPACLRSVARWRCCAPPATLVLSKLPIAISPTLALWEMKCVGLILIFVYTFFMFA